MGCLMEKEFKIILITFLIREILCKGRSMGMENWIMEKMTFIWVNLEITRLRVRASIITETICGKEIGKMAIWKVQEDK